MKKGFLPVIKGRLYWAPEEEKVPWSITKTPKGSVVLSEFAIASYKKVEAFYCEPCKMVIISTDKK